MVIKQSYHIIIEKDEDGRFLVTSPDVQGLVTDGATEDEAVKNAYEAVRGIIEGHGLTHEFNLIIVEPKSLKSAKL